MIVFVSAPFRAQTGWDIYQACNRAEVLCAEVVKLGALPVCAHVNSRNHHGLQSDTWWLGVYCELLERCDVVLMAQGWEESVGCRVEHDAALKAGKAVVYSLDELRAWLAARAIQT